MLSTLCLSLMIDGTELQRVTLEIDKWMHV